ncbi:hypothetical protein [Altericroceibacterium spongiae]|uniref:hypothetical protein n=1 Tax=Altericroceibacterium spongiae TaxID=2320269 RepID=UPI0011C48784|nr:hypothetical protein [Altericroceibacterium spongiae]
MHKTHPKHPFYKCIYKIAAERIEGQSELPILGFLPYTSSTATLPLCSRADGSACRLKTHSRAVNVTVPHLAKKRLSGLAGIDQIASSNGRHLVRFRRFVTCLRARIARATPYHQSTDGKAR